MPLLDKINSLIQRADVIVADCTGRNPNVFYELGIAHALDKPVVLITQDQVEEAPTDVRSFEFITYGLGDHIAFLGKLDRALARYLRKDFTELFAWTKPYVDEFSASVPQQITRQPIDDFSAALEARLVRTVVPSDDYSRAKLLMPLMIGNANDLDVAVALADWIRARFPGP